MLLDKDKTRKVATLANLPISDEDLDTYSTQISKILDYIDQLEKVDISDVDALYNVSADKSKLREDETKKSLHQDEALQNAVKKSDGYFVTKGVFDNE